MFRINKVHIRQHQILGNIDMDFQEEESEFSSLFTSIIIGQNATGKSNILKLIMDLFRLFDIYKNDPSKKPNIPCSFLLRYTIDENIYEIATTALETVKTRGRGTEKHFVYYKNKPIEDVDPKDIKDLLLTTKKYKPYEINLSELEFPSVLLANSIMLTDKFNSANTDFYKYLGVRNPRSPSTAGTRTYIRKTTDYIVECLARKDFRKELSKLLDFLGLDNNLNITYVPKYRKLFWSENITIELFHNYFKNWKESFKRDSEPWGKKGYLDIKDDPDKVAIVVSFLNSTSKKLIPYGQGGRYFAYNILKESNINDDFETIKILDKLDLVSYPSLHFSRNSKQYNFEQSSSGETHFISSFIGLLSQIRNNGLILIDEPEISLHPNWQIEYIYFLKTIFKEYPSCHFVIATHSHFILSDLLPDSSNIIALSRNESGNIENIKINYNTYGWSVDEILYKVFNVRSTRNKFFENDLRNLYNLITNHPENKEQIKCLINRLSDFQISSDDPLVKLLDSAKEVLNNA
ncbi:MAG: AAA family ATPase [Dysgonomonas mossii]|uniref:AAA family ATPase n=1 Tax=Dysgonomonas mossii TaxID=163665 RepID=UPI003991BC20